MIVIAWVFRGSDFGFARKRCSTGKVLKQKSCIGAIESRFGESRFGLFIEGLISVKRSAFSSQYSGSFCLI